MGRNPRPILIRDLQAIAKRIRSTIGLWQPDGGMAKAAQWGKPTYLERDPEQWQEIAFLGVWLAEQGIRLAQFAVDQKKALESAASTVETQE